jgi:flavin reductase (DIM6/NTAB) family NADH-FMN oxidoreductase RutF
MKEKIALHTDKREWRPSPLPGQLVLVTTLNEDGVSNVAPKRWISMAVFQPPLLMLGCNLQHQTAQNILRSHEFVVNVPGAELADAAWRCSDLPHPRPVQAAGWTPIPALSVKPPRIEECKAHLECVYERHLTFGDEVAILGRIVAVSVDKAAAQADDPYAYLRLCLFLENGVYGVIEHSRNIGQQ